MFACYAFFLVIIQEGFVHGDFQGGHETYSENKTSSRYSSEQNTQGDEEYFRIYLKRTDWSTKIPADQYGTTSIYTYDKDTTIELTCYHNKKTDLEWTDGYSFTTGIHEIDEKTALRVTITPDKSDNGTTICCKAHDPEKQICLELLANPNQNFIDKGESNVTIVNKNTFLKATCNGTLYYPGESKPSSTVSINKKISQSFQITDSGTTVLCFQYNYVGIRNDVINNIHKSIYVYERKKWKYIYTMNESAIEDTSENNEAEYKNGFLHEDTKNKVGVIAGILGAVIVVLLVIIVVSLYSNKRISASEDSAEVIYAEIDERPAHLPPPTTNQQSYAQIVGTFVPMAAETMEEHIYCTLD